MNWHVLWAIFKRNFVSYFSNPTGYVFICVFVALSSLAAFWPNEFFNANLANLDQLNEYIPAILLIFIPAITMSVWSEERRQGTDELLLTLPASDLDVVLGKYLASLAIYSVALAFSFVSNFLVLKALGNPDFGLYFGTYVGYWLIGMAMLSIGMVASFLTSNLTVGFILGAVFNAPLVLAVYAESIFDNADTALYVRQWSIAEQFRDFERGVLSLSSFSYFALITAVMLYVAMVLIGRRHWMGGRDGRSLAGHYLIRSLALLLVAAGVSVVFAHHDPVRLDVTSEQLSSLSPQTRTLIKDLKTEHPVVVEAFISPSVPAEYVQTRLNLISVLDELSALGGDKVQVHKHAVQNFTDQAVIAEKKYGIKPQTVMSKNRGAFTQEKIFMGVAFTCGLEKEVLPFIDRGLPPEYELVRSICVVAQEKRQKIGVLKTEAALFGGFDPRAMSISEDQAIVTELRKQYDVEEVDATKPIETDQYAMLLAVQPSTLEPPQLQNFIAAVRKGLPTAVFEDPLPRFWRGVRGTMSPGNPHMGPPSNQITQLWDLLGVDMIGDQILSQAWNPYPKITFIEPEFIFIGKGSGARQPFNEEDAITSGLQQVAFFFAGSFSNQNKSKLDFRPLCDTNAQTMTINLGSPAVQQAMQDPLGTLEGLRDPGGQSFIVAAQVSGKVKAEGDIGIEGLGKYDPAQPSAHRVQAAQTRFAGFDGLCADEPGPPSSLTAPENVKMNQVNVVLVADIDCLVSELFRMRARGQDESDPVDWKMQNVAFVLNVVDALSGDKRFMEIRKRQQAHRTLEQIEKWTDDAFEQANKEKEKFNKEFEKARTEAQNKFDERLDQLRTRTDLNTLEKSQQLGQLQQQGQRQLLVMVADLQQKRDRELKEIQRELDLGTHREQDKYKLWALLLPPIPPLLIAFFVYFHRRSQEREGVSKSRLV